MKTVLLIGIPSESPIALVRQQLVEMGIPHVMASQRAFDRTPFWYEIVRGEVRGAISVGGMEYPLESIAGVYTRMMDDQRLPEVAGAPDGSPLRARARAWHAAVSHWCEIAPARVVNRIAAMGSNASKPFQAQVILRHGFRTPETLITSDPDLARAFLQEHGRVVFKSISGIRSIVRELDATALARLGQIRWCPVQFQQFVDGQNVRVHVVGDQVFGTAITTEATDYRYARRDGLEAAALEAIEVTDELAERCVALATDLDLPFAGIDVKVTPDEEVYCFEVNPSPAYAYYESHTGQPISLALSRYLAGQG
jgi:hypothetical protein